MVIHAQHPEISAVENRMKKTAKSHLRSTLREMAFEQLLATVRPGRL